MPGPIAIESFLELAREDLDVARQLQATVPRAAAFHLQQAAEKLTKAALLAEGIEPAWSHDIGDLARRLPEGNPWRSDLLRLDHLTGFATELRYPVGRGSLPAPPAAAKLAVDIAAVEALATPIAAWCRDRLAEPEPPP